MLFLVASIGMMVAVQLGVLVNVYLWPLSMCVLMSVIMLSQIIGGKNPVKTTKIFWGLFFIALAGLIMANQLGWLNHELGGATLLMVMITILMVSIIIKGILYRDFFSMLLPVAIIIAINDVGGWGLWTILLAALLLSIGLTMLFGAGWHKNGVFFYSKGQMDYDGSNGGHWFGEEVSVINVDAKETSEEVEGEVIRVVEKFGASSKYVKTQTLERMEVKTSFGAMKIYFTETGLKNDAATVYLDVSFAGMEIYVPRGWRVQNSLSGTFGGIDEKNRSLAEDDAPILHFIGEVKFGGIEIIYV